MVVHWPAMLWAPPGDGTRGAPAPPPRGGAAGRMRPSPEPALPRSRRSSEPRRRGRFRAGWGADRRRAPRQRPAGVAPTATGCTCPSASTGSPRSPSTGSCTSGWRRSSRSIGRSTARTGCHGGFAAPVSRPGHDCPGAGEVSVAGASLPAAVRSGARRATRCLAALGNSSAHPAHQIEAAIRYALGSATPPSDPWLVASVDEARLGTCPAPARTGDTRFPFCPCSCGDVRAPRSPACGCAWLKRHRRRRGARREQVPCPSSIRARPSGGSLQPVPRPRESTCTVNGTVARAHTDRGGAASARRPPQSTGRARSGPDVTAPGRSRAAPVRGSCARSVDGRAVSRTVTRWISTRSSNPSPTGEAAACAARVCIAGGGAP